MISEYNKEVEQHYIFIKENLDSNVPSNLKILRSIVDTLHQKLQKLESVVTSQLDNCQAPCTVSCNIPVVSGKGNILYLFLNSCSTVKYTGRFQEATRASCGGPYLKYFQTSSLIFNLDFRDPN